MYACVFCGSHFCANDCQFLDNESEFEPMTKITAEIAVTLAFALYAQRDGFTINRDGSVPDTGVAVADHTRTVTYSTKPGLSMPRELELGQIAAFILANREAATFGIWEQSGTVYLDVIDLYPSTPSGIRDAIRVGHASGELAVFDLATGTEYPCTLEGES